MLQISCFSIILVLPGCLSWCKAFYPVILIYMEGLLASHLALVDEPRIKYMRKYSTVKPQCVASVYHNLWQYINGGCKSLYPKLGNFRLLTVMVVE
jgi:hypothetical protein